MGLKRCVLALVLVGLTVPLSAQQQYQATLKISVAASAVTFADAASSACTAFACILVGNGHPQAITATCVLTASSGTITYRIDGTAPTSSTGIEVSPGSTLGITGNPNLLAASFIRTGSTSGDLRCTVSGAP